MDGMQKHLVCRGSGRVPGAQNGSHGVKAICRDCGGHGIRRMFSRALDSNKPKWSRPDADGRQTCLGCKGMGQKTGDDRDCASCEGEGYRWR